MNEILQISTSKMLAPAQGGWAISAGIGSAFHYIGLE